MAKKKPAKKKPAPKKAAPKKKAAKAAAKAPPAKRAPGAPAGWQTLTAGCAVPRAASALRFYQALFGAKVGDRMDGPNGELMHADVKVGDSRFMMGEAGDKAETRYTMTMMLYTNKVDLLFNQATASGCEVIFPLEDQFWGDRSGRVRDPFGNQWMLAQHTEDVSPAEMGRRFEKMAKGQPWK
jgi:PhnB protein